jgi:hypothetical protein
MEGDHSMSGGGTTIAVPSAGFSPATILARIKTVDGTGSGLDADLVRGTTPSTAGLSILALASIAVGGLLLGSGTNAVGTLAIGAASTFLKSNGTTAAWTALDAGDLGTGTLAAARGGTGVSNAGTLTNASNTTITGGGTLALAGFTLTVPATGTAGLLGTAQTWSAANIFSAATTNFSANTAANTTTGTVTIGNGVSATNVGIGQGKVVVGTRLVAVAESFSAYGVESTTGGGFAYTTTDQNGIYTVDYRRIGNTAASGSHNARSLSGSQYGTIASGQTNSGNWTGLWAECLRNYVATGDTGTLTQLEGARITVGHFSTDASTPTTTTMKGLYMPLYRSTGSIGTLYGIHIDNGSTTITPTLAYGLKIENTTGTTAYAIHTGTGLVSFGDEVLTVASSTTRAGLNIPHGAAPSSPVNGDMWTTTAGLFVRINGATIGPLS